MKSSDLKVLERLAADPDVKGRKLLRKLIWYNTVQPKYNVGDCYCVTDPAMRIYGVPVKGFHARIAEVKLWHDGQTGTITYRTVAHVVNGDKVKDIDIVVRESMVGQKVDDNMNVINGTDKYAETLSI